MNKRYGLPQFLGVSLLTFFVIAVTYKLGFATQNIVTIWPSAAVTYWVARKYGKRALLPIIIAESFHAYLFLNILPLAYLVPVTNAFAAYLGVLVERRFNSQNNPLTSLPHIIALVFGGFLTLAVSGAILGGSIMVYVYKIEDWPELIWLWILSDYTGLIMLAPLLIIFEQPNKGITSGEILLRILPILTAILVIWVMGETQLLAHQGYYIVSMILTPLVLLLAFKQQTHYLCINYTLVCSGALLAILSSIDGDLTANLWLSNQHYITQVILIGYVVHAVNLQRMQLLKNLREERDLLENRVNLRTEQLAEEVAANKRIALEMERLATIDSLTEVLNRRAFQQQVDSEMIKAQRSLNPLCLAMMDIDYFKQVNDRYGHAAGDLVLIAVCNAIKQQIRADIDILGRLGGEEFALLLPDTRLEEAQSCLERCRRAIAELAIPFDYKNENVTIRVTCSFGLAAQSATNWSRDQLLIDADNALYQAKKTGRNKIIISNL
ncbi:sensor domain-containing diguanylate cyclase [Alteromonas gilva]|uniref:diguanylate cyclase n=1 Tax=Alteromonas gilva TaxID=2987522 RepID=A0ABT5KYB0_9ALTE|nr:diguanylate cyclase [Alteromonas gilva]MDC8829760.1 diguanylate cyclase [Alteromonas gilva]